MALSSWEGVPAPRREALEGRYVRLEPLDNARHSETLFAASAGSGAEERFRYLPDEPLTERADFDRWIDSAARSADPLFFAVVDRKTGRADGRQSLLRIDPANGVIEVGHIMWGPNLALTRGATEALYLFADHVFGLGYRRFEWKCDSRNQPSRAAAERFGFGYEGTFRQHMVVKRRNRDTAWFSILDGDWPRLREAYLDWLRPENFDAGGRQLSRLAATDRSASA